MRIYLSRSFIFRFCQIFLEVSKARPGSNSKRSSSLSRVSAMFLLWQQYYAEKFWQEIILWCNFFEESGMRLYLKEKSWYSAEARKKEGGVARARKQSFRVPRSKNIKIHLYILSRSGP